MYIGFIDFIGASIVGRGVKFVLKLKAIFHIHAPVMYFHITRVKTYVFSPCLEYHIRLGRYGLLFISAPYLFSLFFAVIEDVVSSLLDPPLCPTSLNTRTLPHISTPNPSNI